MVEKRANEVFGGAILIGLAVLLIFNAWWPGIFYVIGIALMARTSALGRSWTDEHAGMIVLGIGVFFTVLSVLHFVFALWPFLLIAVGLYLIFGHRWMHQAHENHIEGFKTKNDDNFV